MNAINNRKKILIPKGIQSNPLIVKTTNGAVYRSTGKMVSSGTPAIQAVKPSGTAYQLPPKAPLSGDYSVLSPFSSAMVTALKKVGITPPKDIKGIAQLFHNHILAKKNWEGTKELNFDAYEEHIDDAGVVTNLLNYFKSVVAGVTPQGLPIDTQDKKMQPAITKALNEVQAKVAASGISPDDAVKMGVANVPSNNKAITIGDSILPDVIKNSPNKKMYLVGGGIALLVILWMIFK